MAWTAVLKFYSVLPSVCTLVIVYDNGAGVVTDRSYTLPAISDAIIAATARNEIAGFDAAAASTGKVTLQPGSAIDLTPPAPANPPTPEEAARSAWFTDYRLLQAMQRGLSFGLVEQADCDAQLAKVRAAYLPEYVALQ